MISSCLFKVLFLFLSLWDLFATVRQSDAFKINAISITCHEAGICLLQSPQIQEQIVCSSILPLTTSEFHF